MGEHWFVMELANNLCCPHSVAPIGPEGLSEYAKTWREDVERAATRRFVRVVCGMCVCVCVHVCMRACVRVCMRACMHACVRVILSCIACIQKHQNYISLCLIV